MKTVYEVMREGKYDIKAFIICPFDVLSKGNETVLHPDGEGYGFRIGVLDKAKGIVVETDMECAYKYIPTNSSGLIKNPNITPGNRYAYKPVYLSPSELSEFNNDIIRIVNKLEKGFSFPDANSVYTNEQYVEEIDRITLKKELDKIGNSKSNQKRKFNKIFKINK